MEIKFLSNGKVLDLSGQKLSVSESNSKVSDKMFTKYLFPFEFYMDEEFKLSFGDYSSYDAYNLPKEIPGFMYYNNVYSEAKMEIVSVEGDYITCQIDFGFDEIPNFDKSLKTLPLEKYPVENIHTFAAEVCAKKYPQTNFNFPKLYTSQYSPDDEVWDAFNGFINDMNDDGSALRNNYYTEAGEIYNVNIIQPMPHILYLLKTGFADAGYTLAGDILSDPMLEQQWVYAPIEYFSRLTMRKLGIYVSVLDFKKGYKHKLNKYPYGWYDSNLVIPLAGNYKIIADVELSNHRSGLDPTYIRIYLDGKEIFYRKAHSKVIFSFETDITTTRPNEEIRITGKRSFIDGRPERFIEMKIISKNIYQSEAEQPGEDNGVITNLNEIDLTRAVPDITFGELVNRIRNFLNYDVDMKDKTIYMNKVKKPDRKNLKYFPEKFLEEKPLRNIMTKRSFLLQMPTWENNEKPDSVYYDSSGIAVNKEAGELTTVIETGTFSMPVYVAKPQGPETAVVKSFDTSVLQLVKYDGKTGIQNNAKSAPEITFPTLFFTNWIDWLRGRIDSVQYEWEFTADADEFDLKIKDEMVGYQNIHVITEWVKDHSDNTIQVNIKTETFS